MDPHSYNKLVSSLPSLVEKMRKFHGLYEDDEAAVRTQIIEPALRLLGWDPENPDEVRPIVAIEDGIPDYSLRKDGKPILFVEVKKLGVTVDNTEGLAKLGRFCEDFGEGIMNAMITNGAVWALLRSFEENAKLSEIVVWKVDLENDEIASAARMLSTISSDDIWNIQLLIKKAQILDETWNKIVNDPQRLIASLTPAMRSLIHATYPDYQFSDVEIQDLLRERVELMIHGATDLGK